MKKIISLFVISVLLCGTLTACVKTDGVSTDGSTSMSKVIGALSEAYENETGVSVTYNATGSGSGIQAVLEGRCDIGLSSRELTEDEKSNGLKSTILAYDGIAIIVNTQNNISDLSLETIGKIFMGEITNWSDLGGTNGQIVLIGREAGSGTRDGFESITDTEDKCQYRQELTSTGDVITTVSSNPNAIGYASIASLQDTVKVLKVEGVTPNEETVKKGTYVIQRPFILVTNENSALSSEASDFFDYITSNKASNIISNAGAVPSN